MKALLLILLLPALGHSAPRSTRNASTDTSTLVLKAGDTMTGKLTVPSIGGPTTVSGGSVTVTGGLIGGTSEYLSGNIGIRTATPQDAIHVSSGGVRVDDGAAVPAFRGKGWATDGGANVDSGELHLGGASFGSKIYVRGSDASLNFNQLYGSGETYWRVAGAVRMTMLDTGWLGIGTTGEPASKLHMSSGTLTVDGTGAAIDARSGIVQGAGFKGEYLVGVGASYGGGTAYLAPAGTSGIQINCGNGSSTCTFSINAGTEMTLNATRLDLSGAALSLKTHTIAELQAITPAIGDMYRCSNCVVPYSIVTATAAAAGGFGVLPPTEFK